VDAVRPVSGRSRIAMDDAELAAFLGTPRVVSLASSHRDGTIHLVAMHYAMVEGAPHLWAFAKSQKIRNLERDPRMTMLAESGTAYAELRGVQLTGRAEILRDPGAVVGVGLAISLFYGTGRDDEATRERLRRAAVKRVAVRMAIDRTVSWDHRKLGAR
jgi:nitroimidazol reductase NimA-like FMN-containing flavoprotein (pyridoxamine 5'-phosphate oxidase superfamily)